MFVNELRPGLLTSEESVNQSWDALKELCRKATLEEKNTAVWLVNSFALEHLAEVLDKSGYVIRERFRILGQVKALTAEGRQLKNELYRWKLANQEGIESLKRQVQLYLDHMDEIQRDQRDLF